MPSVWRAAGRRRSNHQALETFNRRLRVQPQNAAPLVRLAEIQLAVKDYDVRHRHRCEQGDRDPALSSPQRGSRWPGLCRRRARQRQRDRGGAQIQKEKPDRAVGYALEGDASSLQKQWAEAAAAFGKALAREPLPSAGRPSLRALQNAGKTARRRRWPTSGFKDHPKDVALHAFIAQQAMASKDIPWRSHSTGPSLEVGARQRDCCSTTSHGC